MEIIVNRKPSDVCTVSAVPTACGGTDSVTSTLNCAESATTKKPQASAMGTSSQRLWPKVNPMSTAQAPLAAIATVTSHSRPRLSPTRPPHTQPAPPIAIAANVTAEATMSREKPLGAPDTATLAATKAGIQVHALYSS